MTKDKTNVIGIIFKSDITSEEDFGSIGAFKVFRKITFVEKPLYRSEY